jgi:hypothetical protein
MRLTSAQPHWLREWTGRVQLEANLLLSLPCQSTLFQTIARRGAGDLFAGHDDGQLGGLFGD